MKKAIVIGCPGSGKTTFAERLSALSGLPLFSLDAIWHRPDRTHIPRSEFDARLTEILSLERWIIDGDYNRTLETRLRSCDTVFLFDLPISACLSGATERLGKARRDVPWIDTELDDRLRSRIESYASTVLPNIYAMLERYSEEKRIVVFQSRTQSDEFLRRYVVEL